MLLAGERLDNLLINDLKIIQHEDEFRFSLDAVLLAHFATVKSGGAVVDLGCGSGAISLLMAARGAGCVTGLEINERVAAMARRSVALNGLSEKIAIRTGDLRQVAAEFAAGCCQLVVANPPYWQIGKGKKSPNAGVAIARHEVKATLDDVVAAARHLLKSQGRFAMVHLPERLPEIFSCMMRARLEPKRMQLVYPRLERKAVLVLVEGIKDARPGLEVLSPLLVYDEGGGYTDAVMAYYR